MKYCPKCETRYDEEIIRFCTKDGSPLIAEEEPKFIEMPSQELSAAETHETDDPTEVTVIRRNIAPPLPPPGLDDDMNFDAVEEPKPRIVVPTTEEPVLFPPPRAPRAQAYVQPPRSNTAIVVLLTFIGTVIVLGGAGILFWLLQRDHASNTNTNVNANLANVNTNLNTNLNLDSNFNFNVNGSGLNTNINANANLKTPTPTPKPTPSPSPSPTESPFNTNSSGPNANTHIPANSTPLPTVTPRSPATPSNRSVNGGVLNGRAISLPTPSYPPMARQMHASGQVTVEVSVDESGRVTSAKAVSGNPLLRAAAESAARQSRINPTRLGNENVRTTGLLLYNFKDN